MPELLATCWTSAGNTRPGRTAPVSPVPIADRVHAVAAAGYSGIGLGWPDLEQARDRMGWDGLRGLIVDAGLAHIEVEFINDWWSAGPRRAVSDRERDGLLAAAQALGARHIKVGCGGFGDFRDHEVLHRELQRLADQAVDHGTRIALEPGAGSALDLTGEAIPLVTELAHPGVGLMLDPWHLVRAGLPFEQALGALPGELIAGVELCDGAAECIGTLFDDTFDRRLLPGEGDFDTARFVRVVADRGFAGPWGVEVMSDRTRASPVEQVLAECREAALRVLDAAGIA